MDDPGLPERPKKSIKAALVGLAKSGGTSHPLLGRLYEARIINHALGGPFVTPWDVDMLDDATIDALTSVVLDLPSVQKPFQDAEKRLAEWRNSHPAYRK